MPHDNFAELRSFMQHPELDEQQREQLWRLILHTATHHPDEYQSQWTPYMLDFPRHFKSSLITFYDMQGLREIPHIIAEPVRINIAMNEVELNDDAVMDMVSILPPRIIHTLNLDFNDIGADGVEALLDTDATATISRLFLGCNFIQDEGAARLFQRDHFRALTTLDLSYNELTEQSLFALTEASASLHTLKTLYLSGHEFDTHHIDILTANKLPFVLSELYLWCCSLGSQIIKRLATGPNADALTLLNLGECDMTSTGLATVANHCPKLETLTIWRNNIDDHGLIALANSDLRNLQHLDIHDNQIGDAGLIALANSPVLHSLKTLNLANNHITDEGFLALANSSFVHALESLMVTGNAYSSTGLKAMRHALEHVNIIDER